MDILIPKYLKETSNFVDRASITNKKHIFAVNHLVKGLKWANLWERAVGVYPLIGEIKTKHTQNLVSSSYSITWVVDGGFTHSWEGVTGDGTGRGIAMQNQFLGSKPMIACYVRRHNGGTSQSYMGSSYGTNALNLGRTVAGNNLSSAIGETTFTGCTAAQSQSSGLFSTSRFSNTDARLYKNGVVQDDNTNAASFTPDTRNCYIFARYNDTMSPITASFFYFGQDSDSNDDHINLYKIVQQTQQILGRQVG